MVSVHRATTEFWLHLGGLLSTQEARVEHFYYNIETFKHLLFRVESYREKKKAKQTNVSIQLTGKWIECIRQESARFHKAFS